MIPYIRHWLLGDLEEVLEGQWDAIRDLKDSLGQIHELRAPVRCLVVDSREIAWTGVVETLIVQHVRPWFREQAGVDIGVWVTSSHAWEATVGQSLKAHLGYDNHAARTIIVHNELARLPDSNYLGLAFGRIAMVAGQHAEVAPDRLARLYGHEAGHIYGLGHSDDPANVMYKYVDHALLSAAVLTPEQREIMRREA